MTTLFASLLLLMGTAASAQPAGVISGKVFDQTGAALPGVAIDLSVGNTELSGTSDVTGTYRFDGVPTGTAELTYRLLNFAVLRRTVTVAAGDSVAADVVLSLSLTADVVVTAYSTFRNVADVENPAENLVGIAASASQGAITAAQLEARPIMRAGEVLETVPGLIVSQHSGEGKPISTTCAVSTWITARISRRRWPGSRSTRRRVRTPMAMRTPASWFLNW